MRESEGARRRESEGARRREHGRASWREKVRTEERERKNDRRIGRFTTRSSPKDRTYQRRRVQQGYTLFIDDITKFMSKQWLEDIFRFKCGRGFLGAYVSFKQRRNTSKLFGFARYKSRDSAAEAREIMDGLSVGRSKFKVSFAKFAETPMLNVVSKKVNCNGSSYRKQIPPRLNGHMEGKLHHTYKLFY